MAEETPSRETPRVEPLSVVWHILAAPQTLLILTALVAVTLAVAGLIPQAWPDNFGAEPDWLAMQQGRFIGDLVRVLGLLDLSQAIWFRFLLALVSLTLFVRAVDCVELALLASARERWTTVSGATCMRRGVREAVSSSRPAGETLARLGERLDAGGYAWAEVPEDDPTEDGPAEVVAVRRAGLIWLWPLLYAGCLVAAAGIFVSVVWGWQGEVWQPMPGEIRGLGHGMAYAVRLDAFDLRLDAAGRLVDYQSRLTWLEDTGESEQGVVAQDVAGIGRPATLGGAAVRQIGYAPVVRLQALSADGRPIPLQTEGQTLRGRPEVEVRFVSPEDQPLVFVPDRERFFTLLFEANCGAGGPAVHIYEIGQAGAERQQLATVRGSAEVPAGGMRLAVGVSYVPFLRADHRPGAGLACGALAVVLVAMILVWAFSPRLLWLSVLPVGDDTSRIYLLAPPGARARRWLDSLVGPLQGAEDDDG